MPRACGTDRGAGGAARAPRSRRRPVGRRCDRSRTAPPRRRRPPRPGSVPGAPRSPGHGNERHLLAAKRSPGGAVETSRSARDENAAPRGRGCPLEAWAASDPNHTRSPGDERRRAVPPRAIGPTVRSARAGFPGPGSTARAGRGRPRAAEATSPLARRKPRRCEAPKPQTTGPRGRSVAGPAESARGFVHHGCPDPALPGLG